MAKKAVGKWVDPNAGKVKLRDWADHYMAARFNLKPKTRASYESLLKTSINPRFGDVPLADIQPLQVDQWVGTLVDRGLSASRVRQAYNLLGAMMKKAVRTHVLASSPCMNDELPRVALTEQRVLTDTQVKRLVAATECPYDLLVSVLAYTGIRFGEAVALRRGRCNLLRNRLVISESVAEVSGRIYFGTPKNHQERVGMFPRFLVERLEEHLEQHVGADPSSLVFTSRLGGPLRYSNFRRGVWTPAAEAAGLDIPLGLHSLRRTFASLAAKAGASVKIVQHQLGHSDPALTLRLYQRFFEDDLDSLATRFDEWFGSMDDVAPDTRRPGDGLDAGSDTLLSVVDFVTSNNDAPSA